MGRAPDWSDESRALAFLLKGGERNADFFIMLNNSPDNPAVFTAPSPDRERRWLKIIDTAAASPDDIHTEDDAPAAFTGQHFYVEPMGCMALQSVRRGRKP